MLSITKYLVSNGKKGRCFVGLSDLKIERFKSKTGWLWSDGSSLTKTELWISTEPDLMFENCVGITRGGLYNMDCHLEKCFICEQKIKSFSSSRHFQLQSDKLPISSEKKLRCISTTNSQRFGSVLQCGIQCGAQLTDSCYGFYYNTMDGSCVFFPRSDVTLSIEVEQQWIKYAIVT